MNKNSSGFSAVILLVILLAFAAVGGAGWYVWNKNQDNSQSTTATVESETAKTDEKSKPVLTLNTDNWDYETWDVTYPTYLTRNDPITLAVLEDKNVGCSVRGEIVNYGEDFKETSLEEMQKQYYEDAITPEKQGVNITKLGDTKIIVNTKDGTKEVDGIYTKTTYDTIDDVYYIKTSLFNKQDEYYSTISVICSTEEGFNATQQAIDRIIY